MKLLAALLVLALSAGSALAAAAKPYQLAPWKDELFQYPKILKEEDGGAYREVEYNRPRDLYARDVERGAKVDPKYVSLDPDSVQSDLTLDADGTKIRYYAVGKTDGGAKLIVVFLHGAGTGRASGVNDWIHGGNFNRIKNLAMRNDAVYLSPSFTDFDRKGAAEMKVLVLHTSALSPGAPVILACGSSGAQICWRLMRDPVVRPLVAGLILFDPKMTADDWRTAAALPANARIPIQIASSREDTIVGWRPALAAYRALRAAVPGYPVRYVLFSAGTHGLSLRMTDWRETINWMLGVKGG